MIDRKAYPVLVLMIALLALSLTLASLELLHSLSVGSTAEGRAYRKAVRSFVESSDPSAHVKGVRVESIEDIGDLGRYTDSEWEFCRTMSDSLFSVIRGIRPDKKSRRLYLQRKSRELETADGRDSVFVRRQVEWLSRLQGKDIEGTLAQLHQKAEAYGRKSLVLLHEPGKRIRATVRTERGEKDYVFVSPRDAVSLTDITEFKD